MKNYPRVAVVILNWNGEFFLEKFLPSVYNSAYPNIEFVIGDNNSTDNSIEFVQNYYPHITIIQNETNYGFAGGYNKVLEQVEADYYVLLNSDVEVTDDWIAPVIDMLEVDPDMVAAQPKILAYHDKKKFEHAGGAGGFIDAFGYPFCRGRIMDHLEEDHGQYNDAKEVFWASGAAFFIKSEAWREAEGFDTDFFAHMEEIDLCWRLKKMDYKIGYCPQSVVYHVGGGTLKTSNPKKTYLNFRNNLLMLQKNLSFWTAVWVIFARLWLDLAAIFKFLAEKKFKDAWAVSRSHQYFFLNIFKTAEKRKEQIRFENKKGKYKGCVIWEYFMNKRRKFSDLPVENFE